jgi:CheY-like chemotaxis protein
LAEPRQARVLIVDDDDVFLRTAAEVVLAAVDCEIIAAARSGEQAIRLHAELAPDLVLLDVRMPGMSGYEVSDRILAERTETRVVLMSASPPPDAPLRTEVIPKESLCPHVLRTLLGNVPPAP